MELHFLYVYFTFCQYSLCATNGTLYGFEWYEDPYEKASWLDPDPVRYYYDDETGFYYLINRYYDPVMKRFISADSFASTGQGFTSTNMFACCNNNPIIFHDPSGHSIDYCSPGGASPFSFGDRVLFNIATYTSLVISVGYPTAINLFNHSTSPDTVRNSEYDASGIANYALRTSDTMSKIESFIFKNILLQENLQ